MLRVWSGGVYEPNVFYDTCDGESVLHVDFSLHLRPFVELGILVWQDFCGFACGVYPDHEEFVQQVTAEAEANVKILRHHPSIVLWCGNNEDYQQILQWGGPFVSSCPLLPRLTHDQSEQYKPNFQLGSSTKKSSLTSSLNSLLELPTGLALRSAGRNGTIRLIRPSETCTSGMSGAVFLQETSIRTTTRLQVDSSGQSWVIHWQVGTHEDHSPFLANSDCLRSRASRPWNTGSRTLTSPSDTRSLV